MKTVVATLALLLAGTGIAAAQDDREKKLDELRREMEKSLKSLQEKFDVERERLQKEFRAQREKLLEKKEGEPRDGAPRDVEGLLRELLKRVDSLEKKVEHQLPKLHELPRLMPKDFDFKRFDGGVPDEWRRWLEQMPKFRGSEDFKFEFKKSEPKKEKEKKKSDDC